MNIAKTHQKTFFDKLSWSDTSVSTHCAVNHDWTQCHTFNYCIHPILPIILLNHDESRVVHFESKRNPHTQFLVTACSQIATESIQ